MPTDKELQKADLHKCEYGPCNEMIPVKTQRGHKRRFCSDAHRAAATRDEVNEGLGIARALGPDEIETLRMLTEARLQHEGKNGVHEKETAGVVRFGELLDMQGRVALAEAEFHDELRRNHQFKTEPKPWLTISEAAEYSGLPKKFLTAKCRDGSLGIKVTNGRQDHPEECYRIKRSDLTEGI